MRISVSMIACSWLATITFMAGFLVFIAKPWRGAGSTLAPVAEGLSGERMEDGAQGGLLVQALRPGSPGRRRNKEKKREKKVDKEKRLKRRRRRMLAEQREYRQWREDVRAGKILEEEDTFEAVLDELLNELF